MSLNHHITLFMALCLKLEQIHSNQPKVVVESGEILGLFKKSFSGFIFESFEGIPYAEPPIKENRFKVAIIFRELNKESWLLRGASC